LKLPSVTRQVDLRKLEPDGLGLLGPELLGGEPLPELSFVRLEIAHDVEVVRERLVRQRGHRQRSRQFTAFRRRKR